jgi:hypothetical protein
MTDRRYISCANTAKLVRAALKKAFPATTFSVRSSTYAGGASIDIRWNDGPVWKDVEAVAQQYASARFDGMIDLKTSVDHWLLPNGDAIVARDRGTLGSMGVRPSEENAPPCPGAERVSFGADYISCSRNLTDAFVASVKAGFATLSEEDRFAALRAVDPIRICYGITSYGADPTFEQFGKEADRVVIALARNTPSLTQAAA